MRLRWALVVAVMVLGPVPVSAAAAFGHTGSACRVPRLRGLTLTLARARARQAGCRLRVGGAARGDAPTRIVERQLPGAHTRSAGVTVWLDPPAVRETTAAPTPAAPPAQPTHEPPPAPPATRTCAEDGLPVAGSRVRDPEGEAPFGNPRVTPGPTELVSGFYLDGGPPAPAGCEFPPRPSSPGMVEVRSSSGELLATQTSEVGHLVEIPLAPGTYTIVSTFVSATFCGGPQGADCAHPTETHEVTIAAGYTYRQDFVVQIA